MASVVYLRTFACCSLLLITHTVFSAHAVSSGTEKSSVSIRLSAEQLARSQLPTGFFPYDFDFSNGQATPMSNIAGYNLVRQASAAFALSEYHSQYQSKPIKESLVLYLKKSTDRSVPIAKGKLQTILEKIGLYNRWQLWAVLRKPLGSLGLLYKTSGNGLLVSVDNNYEKAWSGATALTLYSAVNYYHTTGDSQFNEMIIRWKNGLLAMHVPGRGFREAPNYLTENDYFNGEAWLALAHYSNVFPDDMEVQTFLVKLEDYLFVRYGSGTRELFFHWGMMASLESTKQVKSEQLESFIQKLILGKRKDNTGGTNGNHNTCAIIEGLASYVIYMNQQNRGQDPIVEQVRESISSMMMVNRSLQITSDFADTLPAGTDYTEELEKYRGAFVLSLEKPLMQVDLSAHCLNALLRLEAAGLGQ